MNNIRIISLIPSSTEIVCALGLRENLVGRSHSCDYPIDVIDLPVCSEPRYFPTGSSIEIHNDIMSVLQNALSVYQVHLKTIKGLRPTHIITQSQCEVCAVSTDDLHEALSDYLETEDIQVIDLKPDNIEEVFESFETVAVATEVPEMGYQLIKQIRKSFENIKNATSAFSEKPRIAFIEWIEPLMAAGNWTTSLIEMAGGTNVFDEITNHWIELDNILTANPDKIVIAPCGFSIEQSLENMRFLHNSEKWNSLDAVINNEVYICDGSQYFNRPGPRLEDSLKILTEIYHPGLFDIEFHTTGWIRYKLSDYSS